MVDVKMAYSNIQLNQFTWLCHSKVFHSFTDFFDIALKLVNIHIIFDCHLVKVVFNKHFLPSSKMVVIFFTIYILLLATIIELIFVVPYH